MLKASLVKVILNEQKARGDPHNIKKFTTDITMLNDSLPRGECNREDKDIRVVKCLWWGLGRTFWEYIQTQTSVQVEEIASSDTHTQREIALGEGELVNQWWDMKENWKGMPEAGARLNSPATDTLTTSGEQLQHYHFKIFKKIFP